MPELATFRKNRIELTEYDFAKDIENRVLMSDFTPQDIEILEEILYSSLRIPISVLEQNLELSSSELATILQKLSKTNLFKIASDHVLVDKEMRKYYELQILKFEEDFKPGMEYLQGLLRKVPIHILPLWYSISRSSNNIFESIVEKYLATPQIFQRYLHELNLPDPIQKGIMTAVYQSPDYEVDAADMMKKFNINQTEFEEHMLHLEFNFVCCITHVREKKCFKKVITPFYEWREYLCHVRDTEPLTIIDEETIERTKTSNFGVIEEMSTILELALKAPISRTSQASIGKKCSEFRHEDFDTYVVKLCSVNLADIEKDKIVPTADSVEWLKMKSIDRALYIYRHPLNTLTYKDLPEELKDQRFVRESEKSLSRVVNSGWVFLDDFLKGIYLPLNEKHHISLTRIGKVWKYVLPQYSDQEIKFFKKIIQKWLFEVGITALGTKDGRECFCLTSLGKELFGNE